MQQRGFSLIELVIVVVVLGLLAATALPRFLDVTDDAEDATVEGVAGGFATGVGLVRAQWEIEGRPSENQGANVTFVTLDGIQIGVDQNTGYPTGQNTTNTEDTDITGIDCETIFNLIIQSAPTITSTWNGGADGFQEFRYFTNSSSGTGSGGNDLCFYYLVATVKNEAAEPTTANIGNGFVYDSRIGQVTVFSNN